MNVHSGIKVTTKKNENVAQIYGRRMPGNELQAWREHVLKIYRRMRAKETSYVVRCADIDLIVLPEVYAPGFFTDSLWFAKIVPDVVGKRSLLEIGCGTGIVSVQCARRGARVVATDINPAAIRNTQMNVDLHRVDVAVREGNVYSAVGIEERFDVIFWAHPFNNEAMPVTDMLLRSGFDYGYRDLREYVRGASSHLTERGRLLLGSGSTADLVEIEAIAENNGYTLRVIEDVDLPLEEGDDARIRYLLLEFLTCGHGVR